MAGRYVVQPPSSSVVASTQTSSGRRLSGFTSFAANRRKSFDEMAERMLRPMLQEWLDDNLPGLVEKLVREEIERVARGDAY